MSSLSSQNVKFSGWKILSLTFSLLFLLTELSRDIINDYDDNASKTEPHATPRDWLVFYGYAGFTDELFY